ncbi:MogA/MoaB family molybdenum cofactor biosynthesis protein [Serpentinicella alkaliphila]|nr:MogA/MoaB family molybdenum cofactor biosynthesis protein [Serpentinicella alkaliphila]QUH27359.1 MogA/MoaB family molybdenum cofactor biosynthesis protein [Serpentinicella alkaliphila]
MYSVGIIVASDKGSKGERVDRSGDLISEIMIEAGYIVKEKVIVPDELNQLSDTMIRMADIDGYHLILTTGGTGFSIRDVTPEATLSVIHREAPGIPEAMRAYSMTITKKAMLSRARAGIRNKTLIINMPGSPKAVKESLTVILEALKHGLDILNANANECAR